MPSQRIFSMLIFAVLLTTQAASAETLKVNAANRQNFYQPFPKSFVCYFSNKQQKAVVGTIGNKNLKPGRRWQRIEIKPIRASKRFEIQRLRKAITRASLSRDQRLQLKQKLAAATIELKLIKATAAQCKVFDPANCRNNQIDALEAGIDCGNVCQNTCPEVANPTSTPTVAPTSTPQVSPTATPTPTFNPYGQAHGKTFGGTSCDDDEDNDQDGLIDRLDPGCQGRADNDESNDPLETCNTPGTDTAYLLHGVDISISPDEQDFTVKLGDRVIRESTGKKLYFDNSGGTLKIQTRVIRQCAGIDVVYKLTNDSSSDQKLPDFNIGGFRFAATDLKYLAPKEHGGLQTVKLSTDPEKDTFIYGLPYPTDITYSPVMVLTDGDVAMGTSYRYPFMEYQNRIYPQLQISREITDGKRDSIVYYMAKGQSMPPHSERIYSVTYRFSPARYYLLTLTPYKEYFQGLYHPDSDSSLHDVQKRNLSPVHRIDLAGFASADEAGYEAAFKEGNERGYSPDWRLDLRGWGALKTPWIGRTILDQTAYWMENNGYRRVMFAKPSGVYDPRTTLAPNFPPAFMNWPASVESHGKDSLTALSQFVEGHDEYKPKTLGFWWGRAGQIPVDAAGKMDSTSWPPHRLVAADYFNEEHRAFLRGQLSLAIGYGATEIGLDAFKEMPMPSLVLWAKEMTRTYPEVRFIAELGNDIIHSIMPIEIHDSGAAVEGPNVLSNYLNPGVEFRVHSPKARAQDMALWGYTYVGTYSFPPDYTPRAGHCFDGIDNDDDGEADFPYDSGCSNEFDDSE